MVTVEITVKLRVTGLVSESEAQREGFASLDKYVRWLACDMGLFDLVDPPTSWNDAIISVREVKERHVRCSVDGCDRPHFAYGRCNTHYKRWKRTGQIEPQKSGPKYDPSLSPFCSVEGCGESVRSKGMCTRHYQADYNKRRQKESPA